MDNREFETALAEFAADRVHGASELARGCLTLLSESARHAAARDSGELLNLLLRRCDALAGARPSMAPIQNLLSTWRRDLPREHYAQWRDIIMTFNPHDAMNG